jgi:hypothetical protein
MVRFKRRILGFGLAAAGFFIIALLVVCVTMGGDGGLADDRIADLSGSGSRDALTAASVTPSINYQGRLTDSAGNPLDGPYMMTFKLYDTASGGTALANDTHSVIVTEGLFSTEITFDPSDFDGRALWLGIKVGGDPETTPRQELRPVPYALSLRPGAVINGSVPETCTLKVNNAYTGYTIDNCGYGIWVETVGDDCWGVYALTSGNNSQGVMASTYGEYSYGVYAQTYGDNSAGVLIFTRGDYSPTIREATFGKHSEGINVSTFGNESEGVKAYTFGNESEGIYVETEGDDSEGVNVYTDGYDSEGIYVDTQADESEGVYVRTYGDESEGVKAYSEGDYSESFYAETDGSYSQGVVASTKGDYSEGIYASSSKYRGIIANTDLADHEWGFYTNDDIYARNLKAVYSVEPIIAESFNADIVDYELGDVVCLAESGTVKPCSKADDTRVVGVVGPTVELEDGELTVVIMGHQGAKPDEEHVQVLEERLERAEAQKVEAQQLKLTGSLEEPERLDSEIAMLRSQLDEAKSVTRQVVRVKADASYGAIQAGDLLTTSPTDGHAMKAQPIDLGGVEIYRPGTIIGKALEPLESGTGLIEVFVTLQ